MKIIGLTGGIGSGKSTVSEFLTEKGFQIIDADKIAREIVEPGSEILTVLSDAFGKEIIREDGSLNRKLLGSIAFSDPDKGRMLNEIMHGQILEIIKQRIADFEKEMLHLSNGQRAAMQSRAETLFIDAPLLLESGLCKMVHEIWVVDAEDEIRIRRIMDRDFLSRDEIQNRIDRQMSRAEKLQKADVVLDNSRSREDLYDQIEKLIEKL